VVFITNVQPFETNCFLTLSRVILIPGFDNVTLIVDYRLPEDLLLNSHSTDSDHVAHTTLSPLSFRLMESALNESFVLSPRVLRRSSAGSNATTLSGTGGASTGVNRTGGGTIDDSDSPGAGRQRSPYFKHVASTGKVPSQCSVLYLI
jgi:hypothetical protein